MSAKTQEGIKMIKIKKLVLLGFVLLLTITSIVGCSKGEKGSESSDKTVEKKDELMGRYVEKEIEFPKEIVDKTAKRLSMIQLKDGTIELFTDGAELTKYVLQKDNLWKKVRIGFTYKEEEKEKYGIITDISYGEDEHYYITTRKIEKDGKEKQPILLRVDVDGAVSKIEMEGWDEAKKIGDSPEKYFKYLSKVCVLSDGTIGENEAYFGNDLYTKEGKKIKDLTNKRFVNAAAIGNKLAYITEEEGKLVLINSDGSEEKKIDINYANDGKLMIAGDSDGNIYMADSKGLHRTNVEGSKWETLMDGTMLTMGIPTMYFESLFCGTANDYFITYGDGNGMYSMKHYVFDKTLSAVPHQTLKVYSLTEKESVRMAAVEFQRQNPDVKIDYRVAMGSNSSITLNDSIKALNVELMGKKGADVLICDNLPVDSYIQKGILADLSDIADPLVEKGEVLASVIESYRQDGKIYTIPSGVALYMYYGKKDALSHTNSLKELSDYAKQEKGNPIFSGEMSYEIYCKKMFSLYQNQIIAEDGSIKEAEMIEFLEQIKEIGIQSGIKAESEKIDPIFGILQNKTQLDVEASEDLFDFMIINELCKKEEYAYCSANGVFKVQVQLGINNSSTQKDLAKEFIQLMLNEEIQKEGLDGVPVNIKALEGLSKVKKELSFAMSGAGTEMFSAEWPSEQEIKKWTDLYYDLKTPERIESEIYIITLLEEFTPFIEGKQTARETVKNIENKLETYLNE